MMTFVQKTMEGLFWQIVLKDEPSLIHLAEELKLFQNKLASSKSGVSTYFLPLLVNLSHDILATW